jgi:hypothetical protein
VYVVVVLEGVTIDGLVEGWLGTMVEAIVDDALFDLERRG